MEKIHRIDEPVSCHTHQDGLYLGHYSTNRAASKWHATIIDGNARFHKSFITIAHAVKWIKGVFPYNDRQGRSMIASPSEFAYAASLQGVVVTPEESRVIVYWYTGSADDELYYNGSQLWINDGSFADNDDPEISCPEFDEPCTFATVLKDLRTQFEDDCNDSKQHIEALKETGDQYGINVELEILEYYQSIISLLTSAIERNHL